MKRFTETEKWKDPWFRSLTPLQKCVFSFCFDNCNNAGFIEIDVGAWAFSIGSKPAEIEGAIKGLGRGLVGASGWIYVRTFLKHQKHLPLNPQNNPAHRQIVSLFKEQETRFPGLFDTVISGKNEAPREGLGSPIGIGKGKGKGIGEGEGDQKAPQKHPTLDEVKFCCAKTGVRDSDAVWFWNKCEANGWTNNGKPIKSWPHTIASWKAAGYLPSQKKSAIAFADKPAGGNF